MLYFRTETIGTDNLLLLIAAPNWAYGVTGEFAARTASDEGLSARGHRRRTAAQTVLTFNWTTFVHGDDAVRLRALLRVYDNQPLLVPFWPGDMLLTDLPQTQWTSGNLRLFYEPDGSQMQVVTNGATTPAFTPTAACRTAPLLWGRFAKQPAAPVALNALMFEQAFSVIECGSAEYAVRALASLVNGPVHGSVTPRLLDIRPNWRVAIASGGVALRIDSERIGYGRTEVEYYVSHTPSRRVKVSMTPLEGEIARLVALFQDRGGSAGLLWMPGQWHDTTLAVASRASGGGSTQITVNDATALGGEYGVFLDSGDSMAARRITVAAGNVLTLNAAPGVFDAGTPLAALLLCRWSGDALRVQWQTPVVAAAALELVELPAEARLPSGETQGTTIGDLGGIWWGYIVSDGVTTWRFTSRDAAVSAGGLGTFDPRPIDHGDIVQELNLAKHSVTLKAGWWQGSPFERWRADRTAAPLQVQIYEGNTTTPSAAKLIFTGRVTTAKYSGKTASLSVEGLTAMLDLKGPVSIASTRCWVPFGSDLCGVDVASLSNDAQLIAVDSPNRLSFVDAVTATWPVRPADYYRHGILERTLPDGTVKRVRIIGSEAVRDDSIPPIGTLDPDAAAWQTAVLGNGGTLGADSLALCNALALALKNSTAWSKIIYLNPFLGADLAAAITPLVNRLGWDRPTTQNLTDNDVGDALGMRSLGGWSFARLNNPTPRPTNVGMGLWALDGESSAIGYGSASMLLELGYPCRHFYGGFNVSNIYYPPSGSGHHGHWYGTAARDLPFGTLYRDGQLVMQSPRTGVQDRGEWLSQHYLFGHDQPAGGQRLGISYLTSGVMSDADVASLHDAITSALMVPSGRVGTVIRQLTVTTAERIADLPSSLPASGWRLIPGCDKSIGNCAVYANRHRFRGFPHLPKSNPALVPVKQETGSGGKK